MELPLSLEADGPPPGLRLEPLLSVCQRLDVSHLSLFGSARKRPLRLVSDVDLHLVMSHLDRTVLELITATAQKTAEQLAGTVRRDSRLELLAWTLQVGTQHQTAPTPPRPRR